MAPSIDDLLDRDAETWQPQPGEKKTGTVVAVTEWQNEYDPYPVIDFDDEDGKAWKLHAYHTVIKNEIERANPQPGDRIGIKYFGEQPTKPGSKYKSYEKYSVVVQKASGAVPDAPTYEQPTQQPTPGAANDVDSTPTTVDDDGEPF